jgi:thioredoxin 1
MIKLINSDADFSIIDQSPTLLQFSASWCGPCKALAPKIEAIADTYPELHILKVDIEGCPELVKKYGVRAVPTLVLLEGGQERGRFVGRVEAEDIKALLDKHI